MRHPTVTLVCRLSLCSPSHQSSCCTREQSLFASLFSRTFHELFLPPPPSLSSVHRMQPRIAWIRSLVSFMFRSRLLRVVALNDMCPIFVPLTLSSNFSHVLASCAAHAARASSCTLSFFLSSFDSFVGSLPINRYFCNAYPLPFILP